jgi:hypothetical protein
VGTTPEVGALAIRAVERISMSDNTQQWGGPQHPGPQQSGVAAPVPPFPQSAWTPSTQTAAAPNPSGPLTVGGLGGALVGAVGGFLLGWVIVSVGLEQTNTDFSEVDGGRFLSVLLLFAVIGAASGAVSGLLIGGVVWSNRKGKFDAQLGIPAPWQLGPQHAASGPVPAYQAQT